MGFVFTATGAEWVGIVLLGSIVLSLFAMITIFMYFLYKRFKKWIRRRRRVGVLPGPYRQDVCPPRVLMTKSKYDKDWQTVEDMYWRRYVPDTVITIEEEEELVPKTWLQVVTAKCSVILKQTDRENQAPEKFKSHTPGPFELQIEFDENNNPTFEVNHNEVAVFNVSTSGNGAIQASMAEDEDEPGAVSSDATVGFEIQTEENGAQNGTSRSGRETGAGLDDDDVEQVVGNSMLTTVQKVTTLEIFDLAQAEGGWWRKKFQNYMAGPTIHRALPTTDVILGQGLMAAVMDPVNRLVTSMITPDESVTSMIEPDPTGIATFDMTEYDDRDQRMIKEEMTRLTTAKSAGIISILDFCQAEGNEHGHYKELHEGGRVPVLSHVVGFAVETAKEEAAEKKAHEWDEAAIEEEENREYERIAKELEAKEPTIVAVHGMDPAISTTEMGIDDDKGEIEAQIPNNGETETQAPYNGGIEAQVQNNRGIEAQILNNGEIEAQVSNNEENETQIPNNGETETQVPKNGAIEAHISNNGETERQVPNNGGILESMDTKDDKSKTESQTSSPSAGGSSTNGQDMTTGKKMAGIGGEALPMLESLPSGIRTTLQACGIPIELNINLQLHGCCHSNATGGESQGMQTQPRVHSYTDLNALNSGPDPEPGPEFPTKPDLEEQTGTTETGTKIAAGKKGTHDGHCHCSMTGSNFPSEENKELHPSRSYGLISLMDFCQAEGSPYGHEEGTRIGLGTLGKQLTAWWGPGKDGGSAGSPAASATAVVTQPLLEAEKEKERPPIPEILVTTEPQQPEKGAEAKEEEEEDFEEMEPAPIIQ